MCYLIFSVKLKLKVRRKKKPLKYLNPKEINGS